MRRKTYLDDGAFTSDLKNLTFSGLAISKLDIDNFGVLGELDVVEDNQGTLYVKDCAVVHTGSNVVVA